jgi:ribosome-associated heat shock protein Hsp15
MEKEKLRIDKYLWAIRIFKTRSIATDAIDSGRVKMQGTAVKPSRAVNVGDEYEIRTEGRKWVIRVSGLLAQRKQHAEAIQYYVDITPQEELDRLKQFQPAVFQTGKRQSKIGRPTKKQRRDIEGFMEEEEPE